MTHKGTLGILNVGAGDVKLSFDPADPGERIRAARIVKDMLRRGYAIVVQVGTAPDGKPIYQRATGFREDVCQYLIADFDPMAASDNEGDHRGEEQVQTQAGAAPDGAAPALKRRGRPPKAIPAESTRAVAVARSAGG